MRLLGFLVILVLLLSLASSLVLASPLSVSTDKSEYYRGDRVTIRVSGTPNTDVAIEVRDPNGKVAWFGQARIGSDGKGSASFRLKSDAPYGTYRVYASAVGERASCTFKVVKKPAPPPPPPPTPEEEAREAISSANETISNVRALLDRLSIITKLVEAEDLFEDALELYSDALAAFNASEYDRAKYLANMAKSKAEAALSEGVSEVISYLDGQLSQLEGMVDPAIELLLNYGKAYLNTAKGASPSEAVPFLLDAYKFISAGAHVASLIDRVSELEGLIATLRENATSLASELERLRSENAELSSRVSELQESYNALKSDYDELKSEYDSLKEENERLVEKVGALIAELSNARNLMYALFVVGLVIGIVVGWLIRARKK